MLIFEQLIIIFTIFAIENLIKKTLQTTKKRYLSSVKGVGSDLTLSESDDDFTVNLALSLSMQTKSTFS